jgi:hypothetical protein
VERPVTTPLDPFDPNAALRAMRADLKVCATTEDLAAALEASERVMNAAQALDEWMSNGGHPPNAWIIGRAVR